MKMERAMTTVSSILLMMLLASFHTVTAMGDCQNHNAICIFNGRLQGTILFREKQGFGCSNDQGMLLDINLEGLDLGDKVTPVNFRVKSFAGLGPNCGGMGADYGSNSRSADLGTFSARGDRLLLTDVTVRTPESMLAGGNSLFGRSVAVIKAGPQQSTEILDCCVIGMVSLQSPASDNTRYIPTQRQDTPDTTNTLDNNNTPFSGSPSGFPAGGSALPGAGSSPSFSGSSFRSPFHLDGKMDFFDLSVSSGSQSGGYFSNDQSGSLFPSPFPSLTPPGRLDPGQGTNRAPFPANFPTNGNQYNPINSEALKGFSFPAQTSLFGNRFGNAEPAGSSVRMGDLFFRGHDKNPSAGLLDTGLFDPSKKNGDSRRYENFLDVGNTGQSSDFGGSSPGYQNDDNGSGGSYYDDYSGTDSPPGGDRGQPGNKDEGDNGESNREGDYGLSGTGLPTGSSSDSYLDGDSGNGLYGDTSNNPGNYPNTADDNGSYNDDSGNYNGDNSRSGDDNSRYDDVNSRSGDDNSRSGDDNSHYDDVNSRSGDDNSRYDGDNSRSVDDNSRYDDVNSRSGDDNSRYDEDSSGGSNLPDSSSPSGGGDGTDSDPYVYQGGNIPGISAVTR